MLARGDLSAAVEKFARKGLGMKLSAKCHLTSIDRLSSIFDQLSVLGELRAAPTSKRAIEPNQLAA